MPDTPANVIIMIVRSFVIIIIIIIIMTMSVAALGLSVAIVFIRINEACDRHL